jgi:hypothetical protein
MGQLGNPHSSLGMVPPAVVSGAEAATAVAAQLTPTAQAQMAGVTTAPALTIDPTHQAGAAAPVEGVQGLLEGGPVGRVTLQAGGMGQAGAMVAEEGGHRHPNVLPSPLCG